MKLFYRELGTGHPLIILHGLFGMSDNWFSIAKRLSEHYHVYLPDLRNHGNSPHSDEFNYAVMADDVREFILEHHLDPAYLAGHSLGGKVGMTLALKDSRLISKLVVIDMAPRSYKNPFFLGLVNILHSMNLSTMQSRQQADDFLSTAIRSYAIRQFILKNLSRSEQGGFQWKFNLSAIAENIRLILEGIEPDQIFPNPVLFIAGGLSDYIGDADLPQINKLFPQSRVITIPQASHWVHADSPDALFNELRTFL